MPRGARRLALAAVLCAGCFHSVSYDAEQAERLSHVAVLVRVLGEASAEVPADALGGLTSEQAGDKLEGAMSPFEAAERIRSALVQHLPEAPPWNTIVPSVQVETALGSLLTVERPVQRPDFDVLQQLGIDGVVYVEITAWGARTEGETAGYFIRGRARMLSLPEHDTLWAAPVEAFGGGPLKFGWMGVTAVRDNLGEVCATAGRELALQLGGTPQASQRTPSLEAPDIEDTGHPPPQMQPVIPFAVPDAGFVDAGIDRIDLGFPDGGLPTP